MTFTFTTPAAVLCLCALGTPFVCAQGTRREALERQRAEKAAQLHEYEPGRLEKLLLHVEQTNPLGRLAPRNGWFVRYGYHDKPVGAGIGFGGGYRRDLFGRRARVVTEAGITFRNYQLLRADFALPDLAGNRAELGVEATYRHNPQQDFYGTGPESLDAHRVSFRLDATAVMARALVRPRPWLTAGVHAGRLASSIGRGSDARFPSIEDRFDDAGAPGLAEQPDFGYADVFATVDYRDHPGNARSGGYYSLMLASYADLGLDRYAFRRVDLHAQQFFPIFDKKRVFALQGRVLTSSANPGQTVPFYLQPTLGGSATLRSLRDDRFRDDHVLYLNAEYRWEAVGGLDMALFTDAGKVAHAAGDLDLSDLTHAYGIGLRVNSYKNVFLRVDVGAGAGEGVRYFMKFSTAF